MRELFAFLASVLCLLTACGLQREQIWLPDERSGFGKFIFDSTKISDKNSFERTLSRPVNPKNPAGKKFDLYYFVRMPTKGTAQKTVLFIPGGPGHFIPGPFAEVTFADFLVDNGYNVVFYHARGAGFSQIPPSNTYDKFLKTSYVLDDIEAIRQDLTRENLLRKDGKWDAVIGYSYGTVVAQQYAGTYKNNLERLILVGVQSRHGFQSSADSFDEINGKIRDINRATLENIFQRAEFSDLTPQQTSFIIDKAFGTTKEQGIFQMAEEKFGTLGFLVSAYCELQDRNELGELQKYSQQFFRALWGLRNFGWVPALPRQVQYGMNIRDGVIGMSPGVTDCGLDLTGSSDRVFNVVSIYDGINMNFLKQYLDNGKRNMRDAVRASGGKAHYIRGINKYLNKVEIGEGESIEPWDPARYRHDRPTLIVTGTADTVTVGDAAEHIFLNALGGARILIIYPGVGHFYVLPRIPSISARESVSGDPPVCTPSAWILECLIYSFLEMSPGSFGNPNDNKILPIIMKEKASVCYRDQTTTKTFQLGGECP